MNAFAYFLDGDITNTNLTLLDPQYSWFVTIEYNILPVWIETIRLIE